MDPIQIYEELKVAFGETQARVLTKHLSEIYEKVSQLASKEDFHKLQNVVYELAEAQRRTEQRVEELTEGQKRLEETVQTGFKKVSKQISALGSRWGIKNEAMLRKTISSLAKEFGYSVSKGFYGNREVDIIIHNGIHILLEVTSSALKKDVKNLNLSAEDYQKKHNIEPRLVLAAVYISPTVMREITESPRRIEVFSGDEGDEEVFIL